MEYRIIKGWRIFAAVIFILFAGAGLFLAGKAFMEPVVTKQIGFIIALWVAIVVFIGLAWRDAMRTLVLVDERTISVTRAFRSRSAGLQDIDGYRVGEKDRFSIQLKDSGKTLQIPQYLERRKELLGWIKERYQDLDKRERMEETAVLLEDDRFGVTREDREARLALAKKFDGGATAIGIGLLIWSIAYPRPFETLMILLFIAPWLAVGITWYFKGLLKLYKQKKSPYPSMIQLMLMATFAVVLIVVRSYDLYSFGEKAWSLLAGGTVAATIICIGACWQAIVTARKKIATYTVVFILAAAYSYSLLIFSNCYYDKSSPTIFHVAVTSKRVSSGRSTSYYVSLSPWGQYADGNEVSVSQSFYKYVSEQDSLSVYLKYGKWGIPWYRLRRWPKSY